MNSLFAPAPTDRILRDGRKLFPNEAEGIDLGEVWIDVRITNAADESMVREGYKTRDQIRSVSTKAFVDTGAVQCVLPAELADRLGLARPFTNKATFADGRSAELPITEPVLIELLDRKVFEECFVVGEHVIIGQTALESTDLFVDCKGQRVVPNPAHPGQAIIRMF